MITRAPRWIWGRRPGRRLAEVEERLTITEMRLRNLFGFTAMMALHMPGGCFFCRREDGHAPGCDFHSSYWSDPASTIWMEDNLALPDAWEEGAVCEECGGTYPDHNGWCNTEFCQLVSSGALSADLKAASTPETQG